jgi:uroporphyrinogen decarboxylase
VARLLDAIALKPVDCTPVWFMRQAGRYQAEYRELRKKHSILEICKTAELAATVTMMPVRGLPGLDAAIIFSDILLLLQPMGLQVEFIQSEGPQILNAIASDADVDSLKPLEPERDLKAPLDAIRIVKKQLSIPLVGFAGAPFTLASYAIEGGPSRNYLKTKGLMYREPKTWDRLMTKLAVAVAAHLKAQAAAGADVVQLFDSWVGVLSPQDYREFVLPYSKKIFDALKGIVPTIHFGTETGSLLELMKEAGGDCIGVDWRETLGSARRRLGSMAVQGNLDPVLLMAPRDVLLRHVDDVLREAGPKPGHIFNLGHGILPETPVENVVAVIEHVHAKTRR